MAPIKVKKRRIQKENLYFSSKPPQEDCNWCGKIVPRSARHLDRETNSLIGKCPHCGGALRPMDA